MVRRNADKAPTPQGQSNKSPGEVSAELYSQVESLQQELLLLTQRAEKEIEAALQTTPEPVLEVLQWFAGRVGAQSGAVWLDAACMHSLNIENLPALLLSNSDRMQCGLALSGREMAFDFSQCRIFFPVVVFENPVAVAAFEIPTLSSANYEHVCKEACDAICQLRSKLKTSHHQRKKNYNAAS